ncbi:hypothetical protein, partial [Bifidobacterium longum]|uniref:hypothetical protein n=1 Tax=Bifidobacterium longum TaxID=216816 RepID=UPI001F22F993
RRIFDAVERPTVFPATVFVSVASGHLTLLAVGQVLQRSLEPAGVDLRQWVWDATRVLPIFAWHPTAPRVMAVTGVAGMASFRGFQFECVGWGEM